MSDRSRLATLATLVVGAVTIVAACGGSSASASPGGSAPAGSAGELVIGSYGGTWGRAIQLGFVDAFQRDTGIKVTLTSTFDGAKSAAAVKAGNLPPEDLIDAEFGLASTLEQEGLLTPIDYASMDQALLAKIPETLRKSYGTGFGYFGLGLVYRTDKYPDNPPTTWKDFWNFEGFQGPRGMLVWPGEPVPEFPLLGAGVAVDALTPIDYSVVEPQLDLLKPHVPKFAESPSELIQQLADGTVHQCSCPTHRAAALQSAGFGNLVAIAWDTVRLQPATYSVWKNAPNKENAMKFIEYVLGAEAQARWATVGYTAPVNPDAFAQMTEAAIANTPNSPEHSGVFYRDEDWYIAIDPATGKTNFQGTLDFWNNWITGS